MLIIYDSSFFHKNEIRVTKVSFGNSRIILKLIKKSVVTFKKTEIGLIRRVKIKF